MRVLLLGHLGKIGSRYAAILNTIGTDWVGFDVASDPGVWPEGDFSHVIVATPTEKHVQSCLDAINIERTQFLCEKPLSKSVDECEEIISWATRSGVPGYVVNNYWHLSQMMKWDGGQIRYDYFNAGDELDWGCCQLIYLDPKCELRNGSPFWSLYFGEKMADYAKLELSYVRMIWAFLLGQRERLWTLEDGLKMTRAVIERRTRG